MPAPEQNLKPTASGSPSVEPMCSTVIGAAARVRVIGAGHKVAELSLSVHHDQAFRFLVSPYVLRQLVAQCLAVARDCGEDVSVLEMAAAALEPMVVRHTYSNPLPSIEWRGPVVPRP